MVTNFSSVFNIIPCFLVYLAYLTSSQNVINSYWIKQLDSVPKSVELIYSDLDEKTYNFFVRLRLDRLCRRAELSTHWRNLESALEFNSG